MNLLDVVICVGPGDARDIRILVDNIKQYIIDVNKIYLIMPTKILEKYSVFDPIVTNIDENIFPFNKEYIDNLFKNPQRSGWYLQQLLKIYAPIVITEILDKYIIIDADLKFYKKINFFEDEIMLFNTASSVWEPYISHLKRLYTKIQIKVRQSGITNLMPMRRHIVEHLLRAVKEEHGEEFWKVFLNKVDPRYYNHSGASEYEILFHFSLTFYPNECKIRPVKFGNATDKFTYNNNLVYEARQIK